MKREHSPRAPGVFGALVRHFFSRFFDTESLSPQGEPEAGVIQTLGILAVPGAFFVLLFRPLTLTGWSLVAVRYMFVSFSMTVMGFLMVFEWDALFPDRRDYQVLTPQPVRLSTLFLAKAAALAIFLGIFLLDVNFFSVLMWPGVDGGGDFLRHLVGPRHRRAGQRLVRRAGGRRAARRPDHLPARMALSPRLGRDADAAHGAAGDEPVPDADAGVPHCNGWRPITPTGCTGSPASGSPASTNTCAPPRTICRCASWASSPRGRWAAPRASSCSPSCPATAATRAACWRPRLPPPPVPAACAPRWTACCGARCCAHPVEYAVFHFISQTITRSLKHRLFLATYGGFGAAFAVMTFGDGPSGLLILPLTLSFILVSGLRAAFNFPAELGANWAFQLSEITSAEPYLAATRKWMLACAILPLFAAHGADGVRLLPAGRRPVPPGVRHRHFGAADGGHVLRLPQGAVHVRASSRQGQPDLSGRDLHLRIHRL